MRHPLLPTLLLTPLLLASACASSSDDSLASMRSESMRPERQVPGDLAAMREDMAEMRTDTLQRLDQVMGGAPDDSGYWYTPVFDAIDFAMSWTRFMY